MRSVTSSCFSNAHSDVAIVESQIIRHVPERLIECCLHDVLSKSTLLVSHVLKHHIHLIKISIYVHIQVPIIPAKRIMYKYIYCYCIST